MAIADRRSTPDLDVVVLGSAAGGGVPQWNCRCRVCSLAWAGDPRVRPRTQSSIAVSADGESFVLINASPDLRAQIASEPALQPRSGLRHSPIGAVVLTNGDVDHVAGLLTLREKQPLTVFASAEILAVLEDNPIFDVLDADLVTRRVLPAGVPVAVGAGVVVEAYEVPGKVPLYLEGDAVEVGTLSGATIGLAISGAGRTVHYVPGCARVTPELTARISGADALLFDGTVYEDDEMIRAGVGQKTGARMGHLAMSGPAGSIAGLAGVSVGRKIFIHINNTNPVLIDGSPERRAIEERGWQVAHDGLALALPAREETRA